VKPTIPIESSMVIDKYGKVTISFSGEVFFPNYMLEPFIDTDTATDAVNDAAINEEPLLSTSEPELSDTRLDRREL
jgi:hypothetical protein